MKAAHTRSLPHHPTVRVPRFLQPGPKHGVENALRIVLALVVFGTVAYVLRLAARNDAAPTANPEVGLELLLSGAVTTTLSLGADELKTVRCSSAGFHLESTRETAFPLELAFSGAAREASENSTFYILERNFTLKLNGAVYTLISGTVTTSPRLQTFNASLVNAGSEPLQISGRLVCP